MGTGVARVTPRTQRETTSCSEGSARYTYRLSTRNDRQDVYYEMKASREVWNGSVLESRSVRTVGGLGSFGKIVRGLFLEIKHSRVTIDPIHLFDVLHDRWV